MSTLQKNHQKIIQITFLFICISVVCVMIGSYLFIDSFDRYCHDDFSTIPHNRVGLLLGTSPKMADGRDNLFFVYRIDTAVELFENGKIDYILISGDNSTREYDESTAMQEALIERGVPKDKLVLDYAGFRTLDSVVRAHEVFGQDTFTVISQPFHCERAMFITHKNNINAICANAKDVPVSLSPRIRIREVLARVKVMLDIYVLNTQPKFLGEEIIIE